MAETHEKKVNDQAPSKLSFDSIKSIGESAGLAHLPDQVVTHLSDVTTSRIKEILQESIKFLNLLLRQFRVFLHPH